MQGGLVIRQMTFPDWYQFVNIYIKQLQFHFEENIESVQFIGLQDNMVINQKRY